MSVFEVTPANDRFSKADGYHVVPPPITGNFLTSRANISFAGLDEYTIRKKITESKTNTSKSKTSETVDKTNEVNIEKPKSVHESVVSKPKINKDKVIIEDWNSDDEDDVSAVKTVIRPIYPRKIAQTGSVIRPIYLRMDNVRPRASYSPIKRSYYTKPAFRPKNLKQDVKTSVFKNMMIAGTRVVVNTSKGKMDNDLKKSRWVWRPKGNHMDHVSKEKGSFILKKFEYVNPKGISKLRATYGAELVSVASLVNTVRPTLSTAWLSLCCSKVPCDGNDVWIGSKDAAWIGIGGYKW
ncbi:hypothetical protein Tco_0838118 [Tanacetum coccineum]|uniref:Uncharacterized protein n=1 Tax=Tanacetum coccineum TaxID=301880 RepID=A0ABQ5AMW6_9ASTR